ncbi:hypothetical protein GGTG_12684 [Gaeumannomyces tritici R3-111a-1]|uniref:Zn(2)-C6 fungal-type domain-containing protein n=1 Tax=Gaeumannomyces tritici (strain R3-111a-1) TaxID=644352 RepID=J3PGQ5_GAET3|nr:hypothetical protein GGTG_12684 [Gaeumannomyces tritici R3-111a-1]EJT69801.1 hypothetical protein GGTG_12684 [Gaeumannomyces tritici R3-111a-1]
MAPIEAADGPPPPVARRRTHRKSRFGCTYCKGRRIKCDELRPACSNCLIRGLICSLSMAGSTPAPGPAAPGPADGSAPPPSVTVPAPLVFADALPPIRSPQQQSQQPMSGGAPSFGLFPLGSLGTLALAASSPRAALGQPDGGPPSAGAPHPPNSAGLVGGGPPPPFHSPIDRRVSLASGTFSAGGFMSAGGGGAGGSLDMTDLELFHHFVTFTAVTFGHARTIQRFWAITAPQTGFSHPFVLHAILAVAGLHMVQLAADPARRQMLRRKVDEHWDVSLRLATPLLGDFNDGNSDALHVFTSLTCLYIFARGPQPGSFLLFDAEPPPPPPPSAQDVAGPGGGGVEGGVHDSDGLTAGGAVAGSVSSHGDYGMTAAAVAAAVAAAQGASSTEEWLVFFRGLRSVMKATKTAQQAHGGGGGGGGGLGPREEKKSWGLIDQMFGPDATAEDMEHDEHMLDSDDGEDEDMADAEDSKDHLQQGGHGHGHGHGHHHHHHSHHNHHQYHDGSSVNDGSSIGDLPHISHPHPSLRRRRSRRESSHLGSDNSSGVGIGIGSSSGGGGGFAARSEPMRDLRDVIRQQVAAGDPDRDVYASAFAALATSFATVFDADMNPRHRSAQVVFGWMYHVSDDFVARARNRRPVALAIFAHFVVLLRVLELGWMTRGWPEHLIAGIYDALSPAERLWIRWPMERVGWLPG